MKTIFYFCFLVCKVLVEILPANKNAYVHKLYIKYAENVKAVITASAK